MAKQEQRKTFLAQRKRMLVIQGALYRSGISSAADSVRANLQVEVLARNVISHVAASATAGLGNALSLQSLKNGNLQKLLPLAVSGVSLLMKRSSFKSGIGGALLVAAITAIATFALKKKNSQPDEA